MAAEFLARQMHEFWAKRRKEEGWSYGACHDAARRHHPDLVPCDELSDASKRFDREAAVDMLKAILRIGYQITRPLGRAETPAFGTTHPREMTLSQLLDLWRSWDRDHPGGWTDLYRAMGGRAIDLGEYLLAFDILKVGLKFFPDDVRLRELQVIAMARSGAVTQAVHRIDALIQEGAANVESLGGLASTSKALWEQAIDAEQKNRLLTQAIAQYESAYEREGGYWVGINIATLAACQGDADKAMKYAKTVQAECHRTLASPSSSDGHDAYWPLASLGEAALVVGNYEQAADYYSRAVRAAPGDVGRISSTRRNARLLLASRHEDARLLQQWLPLPRVVVFAGHMIDKPNRPSPRFPYGLVPAVSQAISKALTELDAGIAYASAASGGDILFLEAMLDRGPNIEVNVVLPYIREQFVSDSVRSAGEEWERRLDKIFADPRVRMTEASKGRAAGSGIAYEYANAIIYGIAGIRAREMGTPLAALAVWNGQPGDARGGTAGIVARWMAGSEEVAIVDTEEFLRQAVRKEPGLVPPRPSMPTGRPARQKLVSLPPAPPGDPTEMRAVLFADVVGFSRRPETEVPLFIEHFLRPVNALVSTCEGVPVLENSWGDGLYLVFENVQDAGAFALNLRDFVAATDWTSKGFSKSLRIRIALHVGPVYPCRNPLTRRADYLGAHVNRAARMEGVTPENEVYASQAFAAISFIEKVNGFTCEYVGEEMLPKKFGTFPTYLVRPVVFDCKGG